MKTNVMESFVPDSREQGISAIVRELCARLGVKKAPHKYFWVEYVQTWETRSAKGKPIGSDEVYFKKDSLLLAGRMRDRLNTEDWRPLIASALILQSRLKKALSKIIFSRLVLPPLTIFLILLPFAIAGPYSPSGQFLGPIWEVPVFYLSAPAMLFLPMSFHGYYHQKARLVADRAAAKLVGKEAFLDVMRKLDQMGLPDVETAKGKHTFSSRPGIDIRINNLLSYNP